MAIRDYWVYQKRNVQIPWAIYFVKEFEKYSKLVTIDYTFYHESVPNSNNSVSFIGLHADNAKGYADAIIAEIAEFVEVTNEDYEQLIHAIEDILNSR